MEPVFTFDWKLLFEVASRELPILPKDDLPCTDAPDFARRLAASKLYEYDFRNVSSAQLAVAAYKAGHTDGKAGKPLAWEELT